MATTTTTPASTTNPLREVSRYGQSAWLDYIRRSLIAGGELKRLVDEDGVGVLFARRGEWFKRRWNRRSRRRWRNRKVTNAAGRRHSF
jgi:hypothetical protein